MHIQKYRRTETQPKTDVFKQKDKTQTQTHAATQTQRPQSDINRR